MLWSPAAPEFIREEAEVHLFVPGNSSQAVRELLQTHGVTHAYVDPKWVKSKYL